MKKQIESTEPEPDVKICVYIEDQKVVLFAVDSSGIMFFRMTYCLKNGRKITDLAICNCIMIPLQKNVPPTDMIRFIFPEKPDISPVKERDWQNFQTQFEETITRRLASSWR